MINKVILLGRLGDDPKITKYADVKVCSLRMATERGRGENKVTEWHNVKCFNQLAEQCGQFLKKGRMVYIEGMIQTKTVDDKKFIDIVADVVQFI